MAFSLTDFKKTSRKVDGRQILYPHQLRDDRYLAAIAYAIDYYERMVGRPRHELQAETMMEFFGDPKLARGIVACLHRSYAWHEPTIDEVIGPEASRLLGEQGITSPAAARAYLYRYVNKHHDGFLPVAKRATVLQEICARLAIDPQQIEHLLTLDAPANARLVKLHATPQASDIVNLYNYHSLETALSHAESLTLTLQGNVWPAVRTVHNLARRYGLAYTTEHGQQGLFSRSLEVSFRGTRNALGSYRGSGRRIVRAMLRLLASHPDAPVAGTAVVHLRGKAATVLLDKRALRVVGAHAPATGSAEDAWESGAAETLRISWTRAFARAETAGWRVRRDPEPIITDCGVIVPDFGLFRGTQRAALVLAETPSAVEALIKPLRALGGRTLVVVSTTPGLARRLQGLPAIVVPSAEAPSPRLLATALPSPTALAELHTTKWQRLEHLLEVEGFVDDGRIGEVLEVAPEQVEQTVRGWRTKDITYLPGIGLCTPETVGEIRASLLQSERRKAA